jgi:hypothetical protein
MVGKIEIKFSKLAVNNEENKYKIIKTKKALKLLKKEIVFIT